MLFNHHHLHDRTKNIVHYLIYLHKLLFTGAQSTLDTATMNLDNASDANVNPTMLDPVTSERRYYLDPFTKISREIWRPGILKFCADLV